MEWLQKVAVTFVVLVNSIVASITGMLQPAETLSIPVDGIERSRENMADVPVLADAVVSSMPETAAAKMSPPEPAGSGARTPVRIQGENTNYSTDERYVYYGSRAIPGSDPSTFRLLVTATGYLGYARDAKQVYWYGQVVHNADAQTFEVFEGYNVARDTYAKDKDSVFQNSEIIPDAFPATFVVLEGYAKDERFVYCDGTKIANADPNTFKIVFRSFDFDEGIYRARYARDKFRVYSNCDVFSGADPATFVVLPYSNGEPSGYTKDKNAVFYLDEVIVGADAPTFKLGGTNYDASDTNRKYNHGKIVTDTYFIDANSAVTNFSSDGRRILYAGVAMDAEPGSFEVISNARGDGTMYGKDTTRVYFQNRVILDANPKTFALLFDITGFQSGYSKDTQHVFFSRPMYGGTYFDLLTIGGADPASFTTVVGTVLLPTIARDKSHLYVLGAEVPNADPNTFVQLSDNVKTLTRYFKDSSAVYWLVGNTPDDLKLIPFSKQPTSFRMLFDSSGYVSIYAWDATSVYYAGEATSTPPVAISGADPNSFEMYFAPQACTNNVSGCYMDSKDKTHSYFKGKTVQ